MQITNVSFGEEIADADSRSVVKLLFAGLVPDPSDDGEDKPPHFPEVTTVLCALSPGKVLGFFHH